uniref:CRIB domain-containing protein n=1 Tax=Eptatretus burgeri TaxID=7764 RepID=A0A8C4NEZ8_EPTBU
MPVKPPIYLKPTQMRGQTLRDVLSGDMISPPLGDFRHMMHVGSAATKPSAGLSTFGDLSFLWGQADGAENPAGPNEENSILGAAMMGGLGNHVTSPVLRNAVLLPLGGSEQALVLPAWATKRHKEVQDNVLSVAIIEKLLSHATCVMDRVKNNLLARPMTL